MKQAPDTCKAIRTERTAFEVGAAGRSGAGFTTRRSYRKFLEKHYGLTKEQAEREADKIGLTKGGK